MIERKKSVLFVLGFVAVVLLSLWGAWGGGTAAELFPENSGAVSVSEKEIKSDSEKLSSKENAGIGKTSEGTDVSVLPEEESVRQYATGRHKRNRPLADPFRVQTAEDSVPVVSGVKTGVSSLPQLSGILIAGEDKRCILQIGGNIQTVREGECIAGWTVTNIGESEVWLAGPSGTHSLTLQ